MVKLKHIVLAGAVLVLAVALITSFSESEEKRVKKRFALLAGWVSKEPGETAFTMAQKVRKIGGLFAERCTLQAPLDGVSGVYSPDEISRYAARARLPFSKLSIDFYDVDIDFPEERTARAVLTGRATGRLKGGEGVDEVRELQCVLEKVENKWLFTDFEVVQVLKK